MKRLVMLAALAAAVAGPASAQVPDETTALGWCPGSKDCLDWTAAASATDYRVYRGDGADLPGLLDASEESCLLGSFSSATTGPLGETPPPPGRVRWYLVTAVGPGGEGPAGDSSLGAREANAEGPCGQGSRLVINEIDYDQPGTDAGEFVELFNAGADEADLAGIALVLVNGLTSEEYRRVALGEAGVLGAGEYLVVGSAGVVAGLPPGTAAIEFASSSNNVQNGSPDAVALLDTASATVIDALSYEGEVGAATLDGLPGTFDLVEGTAATALDAGAGSLARLPNGTDTDDADSDWELAETPTPGAPN